jgi:putative holliday junction resolvase
VLGVDLGLARTGLALSDPLGITARPLPNLIPGSRAADVSALVALCAREEVAHVVVGLALLPRSGDDSMMARRARGFAEALQDALRAQGLPIAVHLEDETDTSKAAARRLVESGVKKHKRKLALDSEAARVLVETWIARRTRA